MSDISLVKNQKYEHALTSAEQAAIPKRSIDLHHDLSHGEKAPAADPVRQTLDATKTAPPMRIGGAVCISTPS